MKLPYLIGYELVWQIKSYSKSWKQPFQSWTKAQQYRGAAVVFASLLIREGLGFQHLQSGTFPKNEQNQLGPKDVAN